MFLKGDIKESIEETPNLFQIDNKFIHKKIHENKKKIKLSIIVIVIIGLFIGINDYKSKNVSKKVMQSDFIGSTVEYGTVKIVISEDNLKSIEFRKNTVETAGGIRTYHNTGTIILENKKYKVELPIEVKYIYDKKNREWVSKLNYIRTYDDDIKLEIKEEISEDIIKNEFIGKKINGVEITAERAEKLLISSMSKNKEETSITAYLKLESEGSFVDKKMTIKSVINFDGEKWSLNEYGSKANEESVIVTKPSSDLSVNEIKKDLSMIIEDKKFTGYDGFKIIEVSLEDIENIRSLDIDVENSDSYVITADVSGKNNKFNFEGNIKIISSEKSNTSCEIKFNKISVDNIIKE